jgi:transketolase
MQDVAKRLRAKIVRTVYENKEGHLGAALSVVDCLYALHAWVLKPNDLFLLSKGHASIALYAVLDELGKIPPGMLGTYCKADSIIGGHPARNAELGILNTSGSLGHGLAIAAGLALAKPDSNIYVVMGDGECNEGSVWESLMFIAHHKLKNIVPIIDDNKSHSNILNLFPLHYKLWAFNFACRTIDGHDYKALKSIAPGEFPTGYLMQTIKGKGVSFMEGQEAWHRRIPNQAEYEAAMKELEG